MNTNWQDLIEQCESLVRNGELSASADALKDIAVSEIPDSLRLNMAKLLRRSSLLDLSLQTLEPLLRQRKGHRSATSEERIEYCMGLRRFGAISECHLRLDEIDRSSSHPDALFCRILLAMNQWDWQDTIKIADQYLGQFDQDPYQVALVKTNRIGALVAIGELDSGREALIELLATLQINGWKRILSNCQELMAQILIRQKKWIEAEENLTLARSGISSYAAPDTLFIERWQAVIETHKNMNPAPLFKVAERAKHFGHYETLRAVDYELLCCKFSQDTFDRLYFGSPYICYQNFLIERFGSPSARYTVHPEATSTFDLATGTFNNQTVLNPGSKLSLALNSLFSDFYRPIGIGEIFENVFEGEFFSEENSLPKVRQLISRLRQALDNTGIQIQKHPWSYQVIVPPDLKVLVPDKTPKSRKEFYIQKLQAIFGDREFTSKQAEDCISISRASCNRLLSYGINSRKISLQGAGIHSRYQFTTPSQN